MSLTERKCLLCGKPMGPGHSLSCSASKAKTDASAGTTGLAESQVQAQIIMTRDLLEEARSLGIDVSGFERRLFDIEKPGAENLIVSVAPLMSDLSQAIEESLERELEREPTSLEAEIYEYLMRHGGMSVSTYSKERGLTEEETRKAIDRLVELDMIEVRKV